eukprot:SAG22_NODE_553_length_9168_cov_5.758628_7_plen_312_part_00
MFLPLFITATAATVVGAAAALPADQILQAPAPESAGLHQPADGSPAASPPPPPPGPPRRVMAWGSMDCFKGSAPHGCTGNPALDNTSDIMRQAEEATRRAAAKQLTDLSPTTYKFGPNGTVLYDRCGPVCERLQPKFKAAGLRVIPLVAAFGVAAIMRPVQSPHSAAKALVNLTRFFGYDGINLDFEPLDCQHCVHPSNCTVETAALLAFLDIVGNALHAAGKELQIDYAAWMQTHNFASYESVANTAVDTIASMDTYGKLGEVFSVSARVHLRIVCPSFSRHVVFVVAFQPLQELPTSSIQSGSPIQPTN